MKNKGMGEKFTWIWTELVEIQKIRVKTKRE